MLGKITFNISMNISMVAVGLRMLFENMETLGLFITGCWIGLSGALVELIFSRKNSAIVCCIFKILLWASFLLLFTGDALIGGHGQFTFILLLLLVFILFISFPIVFEYTVLPSHKVSICGFKLGNLDTNEMKNEETNKNESASTLIIFNIIIKNIGAFLGITFLSVYLYKRISMALRYYL